jgi:hypothetical protein
MQRGLHWRVAGYSTPLSAADYIALYGRKDERLIVKDLEGSARGPAEVMFRYFPGWNEENLEKPSEDSWRPGRDRNQHLRNAYLERLMLLCLLDFLYIRYTSMTVFSLLSLFWRNERRFMRLPCCLCVCLFALNCFVIYVVRGVPKESRRLILPRTSRLFHCFFLPQWPQSYPQNVLIV